MDLLKIDGKIALITGAGSGIGEASAKMLAELGATAIIVNTNEERGRAVQNSITSAGGKSDYYQCDVGERNQVFATAQKVLDKYFRLDILVNNAGIMGDVYMAEEISDVRWARMLDVNLMGTVYFSQAFIPQFKSQEYGKIVNVSSGGGVVGMPGLSHYSASKAASIGYTKALAKELGPYHINVNVIAAPLTVTNMTLSANYNNFDEEIKTIPWGRPAYPVDVAKTVLYLASDLSEYMTGQVLSPVDGSWAKAGIIARRYPYQTDETLRSIINKGDIAYNDMHLSSFPQYVNFGYVPKIDIAVVEALAINEDGNIIPTNGVGNAPVFIKNADKVIVEINLLKPAALEGMADIYTVENPPRRDCIPLNHPKDRIGQPFIECDPDKILAIVFTELQDATRQLAEPSVDEMKISRHIIRFLKEEVCAGRLTESLLPLQSGVGSVANAVFSGLAQSEFKNLTCYTEVVQDSMLNLLRSGKAVVASTTAISPSPEELVRFESEIDFFCDKIILRPQEISNNPEMARRLGVIAMNTALEVDIYGNVNSTHIMGSRIVNGIGGSGDFARNAALTIFSTLSTANGGKISSIVPMVSHVDHTEHDVMVIVTEQGYADLRGASPRERAIIIIENCAHPDFKAGLFDYYNRALQITGGQTPHLLDEALSWHTKFLKTGSMS